MADTKRVLVVEDRPVLQREYRVAIEGLGVEVDTASTRAEAIEKAHCRTYHVALIDIMLTEDDLSDRGGEEVLAYINSLREGTAAIVVSATDDIEVPVKVLVDQGAVKYIIKRNIKTQEDVVGPVREALGRVKLRPYGRFDNLIAYLAFPEMTPYYEDRLIRAFKHGYKEVMMMLSRMFDPILPVLKGKQGDLALILDYRQGVLYGPLWSKGKGSGIWINIKHEDGRVVEPPTNAPCPTKLNEHRIAKMKGVVWVCGQYRRDDFDDTLPQ